MMIVEECDMCDWQCLGFVCGAAVYSCWYSGPYAIACIVALCGVGALVCCIVG